MAGTYLRQANTEAGSQIRPRAIRAGSIPFKKVVDSSRVRRPRLQFHAGTADPS